MNQGQSSQQKCNMNFTNLYLNNTAQSVVKVQRAQNLLPDSSKSRCLKKSVRTEHSTATLFQTTLPASRDSWITHSLSQAVFNIPNTFLSQIFNTLNVFLSQVYQLAFSAHKHFSHHLATPSSFPPPPAQTHFDFTLTTSKLKGPVDIEAAIVAEDISQQPKPSPPAAGLITGAHEALIPPGPANTKLSYTGPQGALPVSFHLPGYFS